MNRDILNRFRNIKRAGKGYSALCPAHDDKERSLSISDGRDGRIVMWCHAGCSTRTIVEAVGLTMSDLFTDDVTALPSREPPANHTHWSIVAEYDYTDEDGHFVFQVIRKEPPFQTGAKRSKTFLQRCRDAKGEWTYSVGHITEKPLYRLPELLEDIAHDRVILLVEGEKDVETARALGLSATTHAGGAAAWKNDYAEMLRGAQVVILPDNDPAGRACALARGNSLHGVAASVRMLALPELPVHGDFTTWMEAGGTLDQFERVSAKAIPWKPGDPIPEARATRFRIFSDGELEDMPPLNWIVPDVWPSASLLALYGAPGSGKSFIAMDLALSIAAPKPWLTYNVMPGAVLYIAAEGSAGMRQRLVAWKHYMHVARIPNVGFITETANLMKPEEVDEILRALDTLPAATQLIIFDTLARSMPGGDENDTEDMSLLIEHADRLRHRTSASVLLVHHTRKDSDMERGSTALRGGVDTLALVSEGGDGRQISCEKQKDAQPFPIIHFSLLPVNPSCVVIPASDPENSDTGLTPRLRDVLNILSRDFPARGATATEWQKACEGGKIHGSMFYRYRTALVDRGYVSDATGRGARYALTTEGRSVALTPITPTSLLRHSQGNGSTGVVSPMSPLGGTRATPAPPRALWEDVARGGSVGVNGESESDDRSDRRRDLQ